MKTNFIFKNSERDKLVKLFKNIPSPYVNYLEFHTKIKEIIAKGDIPVRFIEACKYIKRQHIKKDAPFFMRNCPIDTAVPIFNHLDPLKEKYRKKLSFIAEGFLDLLSLLTAEPLLAYAGRDSGDFFLDIYPKSDYFGTQSFRSEKELFYHNDRTYHFIRADYIRLLGMRKTHGNLIYTGYIGGKELLKHIDKAHQKILRKKYFHTSYDVYSQAYNPKLIDSGAHAILFNDHSFRYADVRTKVIDKAPKKAYEALLALKDAITASSKERILIDQGDLFCFPNQLGLHNREIIFIEDEKQMKIRWLIKTYNFKNKTELKKYKKMYKLGIEGLISE